MNRVRTSVAAAAAGLLALSASAQQPPPGPAGAPPAATPVEQAQPDAKPAAPAFTYNPAGRRDPFVSLIGRGNDPKTGARLSGVPGLLINEVSVKGILKDRSGFVAMIQGSDNKTYVIKAGDRLMDGTVKSIVQEAVVFSQDVNDPLSLVKQKEIRKSLRSADGGRG